MDRDDVIRMAQEAGFTETEFDLFEGVSEILVDFAALVAAKEREACAHVCDKIERRKWEVLIKGGAVAAIGARDCAAVIRARGEQ
jgi:hypothetical protein